jgi:hypothetical protein
MKISLILTLIMALIQTLSANDTRLLAEMNVTTEPGKELLATLAAGNITVSVGENNNVNAKFYGNEEAENKMIFSAVGTETGVKIECIKKGTDNFKNLNIKVEITVPSNYSAKLFSSGGNLTVNDITGNVEGNTSGGNIILNNIRGNLQAYTSGGNVVVEKNTGDIDISTAGGNISVNTFDGNVSVSTMGGHITLTGSNGKVEASTAGGNINIDYTGSNKGMDLSTMGGNITANLPSDFKADAEIGTLAGKVTCDFAEIDSKNKITNHVKTKFNSGGEQFKCTTSAGNIAILKK